MADATMGRSYVSSIMARTAQLFLLPMWYSATFPYQVTIVALAAICNVLLQILIRLGRPPKWYVLAQHARDLALALDRMQTREDDYQHQVEELKSTIEVKDKERRLAIRKAKKLLQEVAVLQGQLEQAQTDHGTDGETDVAPAYSSRHDSAYQQRSTASFEHMPADMYGKGRNINPMAFLLASITAVVVSAWQFYYRSEPLGLVRKVVTCTLFVTVYCGFGALQKRQLNARTAVTCCLCWFVVGIVTCNNLQDAADV